MSLDLSDADRKALAKDLAAELDTGRYGSRFVLSRRQLLSIAGGSAGVAGLTALGVDPATAQSAAGQVGTEASPEDVFAYDLDVQNGAEFNGTDLSGVGSLSTEQVGTERHFAGAYAGSDPDSRLDAAVSAASAGDIIHLENASYQADRTISTNLAIVGTYVRWAEGSHLLDSTWTFDAGCRVVRVGGGGPNGSAFQINSDRTGINQVGGSTLNVTFASGTSGGVIDGVVGQVSVTDNGSNSIGDGV